MGINHIAHLSKKNRRFTSGRRAAREILLLCATTNMSSEKVELVSNLLSGTVDWEYMLKLAEFHNISLLIANNFIRSELANLIPASYLERLGQLYKNSLYKNIILETEQEKVLSIFNRCEIETIVLKGTVLAEQLYGNPGMRTVGDIDILVQPEKLALARELLFEIGYEQTNSKQIWNHPFHDIPYHKDMQFPIIIELHWNLQDQRLVNVPLQKIWQRAQDISAREGKTKTLSPEDNLLLLSCNFPKKSGHLLRTLCDITELLKKHRNTLDWEYIIESSYSWGIDTTVYYALKRAKEVLSAPIAESRIKTLKPGFWRSRLLDLFSSKEFFVSGINSKKLRAETSIIVRSIMMKSFHQMLVILYEYHGRNKKMVWLRAALWMILVFGVAFWRNAFYAITRQSR